MDTATFYALVSGTCFTLVGLWWNVVQGRGDWMRDPQMRRLSGGIYLSFLLPGLMSLFAQISPGTPWIWRSSFVIIAVIGIYSTVRLIRISHDPTSMVGPFRRHRWLVSVMYGLMLMFGIDPSLASEIGLTPLQAEALLLVFLIVLAHGLTWEFLAEAKASAT